MAPVKAEHAQLAGIALLAVGIGWAFGWAWAVVTLGVCLVVLGVAVELDGREPKPVRTVMPFGRR